MMKMKTTFNSHFMKSFHLMTIVNMNITSTQTSRRLNKEHTKGKLKMELNLGKGNYKQIKKSMRVIGQMVRNMDMAGFTSLMKAIMRANLSKVKLLGLA